MDKELSKEEILRSKFIEGHYAWIEKERPLQMEVILQAMQEYADQQTAEYKKMIEDLNEANQKAYDKLWNENEDNKKEIERLNKLLMLFRSRYLHNGLYTYLHNHPRRDCAQ